MTDPVAAATRATYAVFVECGVGLTAFVSRLPQLRDHLHLTAGVLGVILLAAAGGALAARPFSRAAVRRLGQRGTVTWTAVVFGAGLVLAGAGYAAGVPVLVAGLLLMGFAGAMCDVAMNLQGALVEQRLGHSIMPRFHAGYSVGTVLSALFGAVMVLIGVPVIVHLAAFGVLIAIAIPWSARGYLPDPVHVIEHEDAPVADLVYDAEDLPQRPGPAAVSTPAAAPAATARPINFWREPRTVLIGLFALAFGFGEGAGNDWIGVGVVDGYRTRAVLGTIAYATFLAGMMATRWFGARALDRFGRVAVLRTCCVTAALGLALFCSGLSLVTAFLGAGLWGVGVSFGYPVGMSAAADDPRYATERVTVVSTIGKIASFAGPPLIGLLGDHISVLRALLAVAVLQLVAGAAASATRPLPQRPAPAPASEPAPSQAPAAHVLPEPLTGASP